MNNVFTVMNCKKSLLLHSSCHVRKAFRCSQHHIIIAAGTVDDQDFSVFVAPYSDTHMRIVGIKKQISWQYFCESNIRAVIMLSVSAASLSQNIAANIVEHPIDKSRAIQSEWAHCPCRAAARSRYFHRCTPMY